MTDSWKYRVLPWCFPLLVLAIWWGATGLEVVPHWLLPSPAEVAHTVLAYLAGSSGAPYDGRFWHDAAASLWRVTCG